MPRTSAADRKRQEAEAHDRAVFAALAWPKEPCPQPWTKERMDELCDIDRNRTRTVRAWTYNVRTQHVSHGCFDSVHHAFAGENTTSQTRGGPWFATEADASLALRWAVCRQYAEDLLRLETA